MSSAPLRKYVVERRSVVVSFHAALAPDDTLLPGAVVTSDDPALTAVLMGTVDRSVTVRVSGGLVGQTYHVSVRVGTAFGNTLEEVLVVEVSDDAN